MQAAAPVLPEPAAYRLRNTAFRSEVYEYFRTKYLAECRQKQFNSSVDDGGLYDLTPIFTEQQVRALLAAAPQAVQAAVPLPLLVRDIARDLGITVPQACIALKPLGNYSTNTAVTAEMARVLREAFPGPAHPAEGVPAQVSLIADARRLAYVADQVRALEPEGSESDVYLAEAADVLRACADRIEFIAATHPTQQGLDAQTEAARSVLAERARQIAAEGYTPEQDDGYNPGVLALHGGLYACHAYDNLTKKRAPEGWQWDARWWKSKDPRSNLVKAGALILAEIERMDRSFAAQAKQGEPKP